MGRVAVVGLLALVTAGACARHTTSRVVPGDLRAADIARAAAMVAADAVRLDAALDDSLTYAHSNGRVDSKTSLTGALVSGRVDYRAIDVESPVVRIFGDTGVVTGPVRIDVAAGSRLHRLTSVYTAVYRWRDGRWRLVAYHSSPVE